MLDPHECAAQVGAALKKKEWTQLKLAARLGVSPSYISDLMNERRDWSEEMFDAAMEAIAK